MVKCQWSVDGFCQCFTIKHGNFHPKCDGEHNLPCGQGNLDLVDIRDPQPKKNPGRGGRRVGAGAPRGNLNAIKSGAYSKQLRDLRLNELRILKAAKAAKVARLHRLVGEET